MGMGHGGHGAGLTVILIFIKETRSVPPLVRPGCVRFWRFLCVTATLAQPRSAQITHFKCTGASFLILDLVEHRISDFKPIQALECDQLGKGRICNSNRICRTTVAPTRSSWRMRRRMGRRRPLRRSRAKRWWCTHLLHWIQFIHFEVTELQCKTICTPGYTFLAP